MTSSYYWILLLSVIYQTPLPSNAQRPFYLGINPGPGRDQLDKYISLERFSTTPFPTRPPGWTHSPLPAGTKVVMPEPVYQPIESAQPSGTTINTRGDFNADDQLPVDARGDRYLVNRINEMPEGKRPFWFLNYKAIEAQRNISVTGR